MSMGRKGTGYAGLQNVPKPANKVLYNKQPGRKNHEIVGAMYAMYSTPDPDTGKIRSLEHVAKVYRKSRQAVFDLFKNRGYKLRSKEMRGLQVYDGIKFTLHKHGYLRGTIKGKKILMHHYVWEKYRGAVPKDHCVYHKNRDKADNRFKNLSLIHKSKMSSVFNPNNHNQYTKKAMK